jgi:hypothetical protein
MHRLTFPVLGLMAALGACAMPANDGFVQAQADAKPYKEANATCFARAYGSNSGGGNQPASAATLYNTCMTQAGWQREPVAQASAMQTTSYAECRSQAVGLSGVELNAFIDRCTAQPATTTTAQVNRYGDCRGAAIVRGLEGDALSRFVDRCMGV